MKELQKFTNKEFGEVRILEKDGNPLFCGSDVAKALGYDQPHKAIKQHCKEDGGMFHTVIDSMGRTQKAKFINEGNLYRLIINSKLPSAEKFERWVFDEVLPQIRKTGGYIPIKQEDTELEILSKAVIIATKTIKKKDEIIAILQPKAEGYDTFLSSDGLLSLNETAKSLNLGRNKMMSLLRDEKILFKDGNDNIAYQRFIDSGYFKVIQFVGNDGITHSVTRVTPKGLSYIHKLISKSEKAVA